MIPDGVTSIGYGLFENCRDLANVVMGVGVTSIGRDAFRECRNLARVVARGPLPTSGADYLPRSSSTKYVVTESHLASWWAWLKANSSSTCYVLDGTEEVRVVLGEGGTGAVGIMSVLGLAPARGMDANGPMATYATPKLSIASFDPSVGRIEVEVKPAEGCTVSAALVSSCVAVEGSDDLTRWNTVTTSVDGESYVGTGRFTCTFDVSAYRFYKVKVAPNGN